MATLKNLFNSKYFSTSLSLHNTQCALSSDLAIHNIHSFTFFDIMRRILYALNGQKRCPLSLVEPWWQNIFTHYSILYHIYPIGKKVISTYHANIFLECITPFGKKYLSPLT